VVRRSDFLGGEGREWTYGCKKGLKSSIDGF